MRVRLRNKYDDKYSVTEQLPKTPLELYDILDRLGVDNDYDNVYMRIDDDRIPKAMRDGGFYDDIFKLNLLAQRLEQLTPAYTAGFTAVLYDHEDFNLDDLILVTYLFVMECSIIPIFEFCGTDFCCSNRLWVKRISRWI